VKLRTRTRRYVVLPIHAVRKWAEKELSAKQRFEGIKLARTLCFYPDIPDLSIEPCGYGFELRIEHPAIGRKGWLRAIFWIYEKSKTIYIVDLFWKKTNAISRADRIRAYNRIRKLRQELTAGGRLGP
jgi:hypothetical protein